MLRFNTNEVRLSQVETSVEDSSALISTSSLVSSLIMPLDEPPPPQPPQTLQQQQQQQDLRHSSRRQAAAENDDILLLLLTPESEIRKSQSTRKKKRGSASSFSSSSTSTAAAAASAAGRKGTTTTTTTTTRPPSHRPSPNWKERDSLVLQDVFWEQELADYATSQDTSIVHRLAQLAHDPNLCDYTESILYEMTRKLQASQSLLLTNPEEGEEKAPLLLEEQLHAALTLTLWSVALVGLLPGPECEDVQWGLDCLHVMPKLSSSLESLAPLAALQKQQQQGSSVNGNNNNNNNLSLLLRRLVLEWVEHHRVAIRSMPRGYPFSPQQGGLLERTVNAALELFCHYLAHRTTRRMTWMERTTKATKMLWETVGWNTQIMRRTKAIPLLKKPLQQQQKRQASSTSAAYRDELRYLQMAQGILLGSNNTAPTAAMLLGKVHAHEILQLVVKHNNHNHNNTLSLSLSSSSSRHHHPQEDKEESHHGNYNNNNDKSTWLLTKGEVEERIRSILDDSLHHYSIPQQQQQQLQQQQQQQQALSLPMMKFPKLELHDGSPPHSESTVLLESEEANGGIMMKASGGNGLVGDHDDDNDHDNDDNDPDADETKYRCCCLIPDSTQKQQ